MRQIKEERLSAAKTKKSQRYAMRIDLGEKGHLFQVKHATNTSTEKKKSQIGKQGEIVCCDKIRIRNPQRDQPRGIYLRMGIQIQSHSHHNDAGNA